MPDPTSLASGWVHVCRTDELPGGSRKLIELPAGGPCLVLRVDRDLYAVSAVCAHRNLSLEAAVVHGTTITCPWHRARFDLRTGRGNRPEASQIQTFEIREIDGAIYICDPKNPKGLTR